MSQEIIKVLEYLGEKLGIAIDWTTENVLPYAEQLFKRYASYKIVSASMDIFTGIVFAVIIIILTRKMFNGYHKANASKTDNLWWEYDFGPTLLGAFIIAAIIVSTIATLVFTLCGMSNLIEWIIIPEIPFAKEIASLLGTTV